MSDYEMLRKWQLEEGTPYPLRPAIAYYSLAVGAFTLPRDAAPVDWTAAGTLLPLATENSRLMDERTNFVFDAATKAVTLRRGIYEVNFCLRVTNTDGVNTESCRIALTNLAGTTVYKEGPDIGVGPSSRWKMCLNHILHLSEEGTLVLRGAQTTDTGGASDLVVGSVLDEVLRVHRIGNAGETP